MKTPVNKASFALATGVILLCLTSPVRAQTTTPAAAPTAAPINQTIERIRIEDNTTRIDELRVGGQTQSITVQPKGADGEVASSALPAYEVKPAQGTRVWNLLKF